MRRWILLVLAILVLAALNGLAAHKESVLRSGTKMYLRLAPVDPRSLMQGDYMALRYEISNLVRDLKEDLPSDGRLVVRLGADGVAQFVRLHRGEPLGPGEHFLRYRNRGGIRLGAESFFFQEGHAKYYEKARYGELRVAASGEAVLAGLAGERLERLGPGR
jgi:uncharacterized membrane-anchored protein